MTSRAAAAEPLEGVAGLVFLGFPLHPAGQPGVTRADHLAEVYAADALPTGNPRYAGRSRRSSRPVLDRLGKRATLHVVDGADHMFHVLKRSGRTDEQVLDELASAVAEWREERCVNVLIGTSGYSYPEWKGNFYPEKMAAKDMLRYYAERFPDGRDQQHVLSDADGGPAERAGPSRCRRRSRS